jgi:hypothetical protein
MKGTLQLVRNTKSRREFFFDDIGFMQSVTSTYIFQNVENDESINVAENEAEYL